MGNKIPPWEHEEDQTIADLPIEQPVTPNIAPSDPPAQPAQPVQPPSNKIRKSTAAPDFDAAREQIDEMAAREALASGGGPQLMTIPTGGTSSTSSGIRDPRGYMRDAATAAAMEGQAATQNMEAGLDKQARVADAMASRNSEIDAFDAAGSANVDAARSEQAQALQEYKTAIRNAEQQVDPDRWWHSRSTPQKVMAFLASMLGGFVEGHTGGKVKNGAVKLIQQAIDRDIAAQRMNAKLRQRTAQNKMTLWQFARAHTQDEQSAHRYARSLHMEAISRRLELEQSKTSDPEKQKMLGAIRLQFQASGLREMNKLRLTQTTSSTSTRGEKTIVAPGASAGAVPESRKAGNKILREGLSEMASTRQAFKNMSREIKEAVDTEIAKLVSKGATKADAKRTVMDRFATFNLTDELAGAVFNAKAISDPFVARIGTILTGNLGPVRKASGDSGPMTNKDVALFTSQMARGGKLATTAAIQAALASEEYRGLDRIRAKISPYLQDGTRLDQAKVALWKSQIKQLQQLSTRLNRTADGHPVSKDYGAPSLPPEQKPKPGMRFTPFGEPY